MTRHLCWVAVLGVATVPDWATACRPMRWRPVYVSPPVYEPPPVYVAPLCPPPPVYVCPPVYHPAPAPLMVPPRVETTPHAAPAPAPPPATDSRDAPPPVPKRPPVVEAIRTTGGTADAPPPAPKKIDPPKRADPDPGLPKFPEVTIPKDLGPLPKLDVPKEPDFRPIPTPKGGAAPADPKLPALDPPKDAGPKLPPLPGGTGAAVPSPAPPPADALLPPALVPVVPDAKKPDALPSLILPPDSPVAPPKESTSKSSPLGGEKAGPAVSVFPAGERATGVYRTVGFYNHTGRDLNLTIEGRAVKLPAKTYLHALLAPTFTWGHGDRPAVRETVPDTAGGLDVVFRD